MSTHSGLIDQMSVGSFGFGRWEASFFFIGPEQSMGEESLDTRAEVWTGLGQNALDDCKQFHHRLKDYRWHGPVSDQGSPVDAIVQTTWGRLILCALGYLSTEDKADLPSEEAVLDYQMTNWGAIDSDTCVIDIQGLPAKNQREQRRVDREIIRRRIGCIKKKLTLHPPHFVVLYGKGRLGLCDEAWSHLTRDSEEIRGGVLPLKVVRDTIFVKMCHPTAPIHGNTKLSWFNLGREIRKCRAKILLKKEGGLDLWES